MKILLATSDLTPLISSEPVPAGGALPALPTELQRAGHEISVAGPLLPRIDPGGTLKTRPTGVFISLPLGHERLTVEVREARSPDGVQMFLLRHDEVFGKLTGTGPGAMNAPAAVLFSKLIVELARRLNPAPDIVQIHDWPGALAPVFLHAQHLPFASVLSIGDPDQQGIFSIEDFGLLNLGWEYFRPDAVEFFGNVNFLKAGILFAQAIVADGDLERSALQMPAYGGGLDAVFREHAGRLRGIPSGLDEREWDPAAVFRIARRYRPASLAGKAACRNSLLAQLGLGKNAAGPVYLLERNGRQRGTRPVEALAGRLDQVLADDVRLIVLGDSQAGAPGEVEFAVAARRYPQKVALVEAMDERTEHQTLAGSDFHLLPGRGRGLSALVLRSLKYGTVPIMPAGPGVRQIAEDYQPGGGGQPGEGGGHALHFYDVNEAALFDTLAYRAPALLESPDRWETLRQRAMIHAGKFSWARTAAHYVSLYGELARATGAGSFKL